jgi:hypothetical protein
MSKNGSKPKEYHQENDPKINQNFNQFEKCENGAESGGAIYFNWSGDF